MLRHVPATGSITVKQLAARLRTDGFVISERSIERDLAKLSMSWSLVSDERRPSGWFWRTGDAKASALASLDPAIAIALLRLAEYGKDTLPPTLLRDLEPWFEVARNAIRKYRDYQDAARLNRDKFRRVADRLMLAPPVASTDIIDTVLQAVREARQLEVTYEGRERSNRRTIHPACVVEKGALAYVLATDPGAPDDIKQFALHRIRAAKTLEEPAVVPARAAIDDCIGAKATFLFPREPSPIKLRLRCSERLRVRFTEGKLAADQVLGPADPADGSFTLETTVANTETLVWLLREFGTDVEVLAPRELRKEFAATVQALSAMYGRRPSKG